MATADLLVYNAEKILSLFFLYFSFFNQVTSIFHLRGGKIKKKLGLPSLYLWSSQGQSSTVNWKKIERSESAFYKYLAYSHGDKSDDKNLLLQLQDQNTASLSRAFHYVGWRRDMHLITGCQHLPKEVMLW